MSRTLWCQFLSSIKFHILKKLVVIISKHGPQLCHTHCVMLHALRRDKMLANYKPQGYKNPTGF